MKQLTVALGVMAALLGASPVSAAPARILSAQATLDVRQPIRSYRVRLVAGKLYRVALYPAECLDGAFFVTGADRRIIAEERTGFGGYYADATLHPKRTGVYTVTVAAVHGSGWCQTQVLRLPASK